jgi:hypothetical protein
MYWLMHPGMKDGSALIQWNHVLIHPQTCSWKVHSSSQSDIYRVCPSNERHGPFRAKTVQCALMFSQWLDTY